MQTSAVILADHAEIARFEPQGPAGQAGLEQGRL
jgi:hypothetical protein